MAPKAKVNPRKKKLDAISTKIAQFFVTETYADGEEDVRAKLTAAIQLLDEAATLCVANDEKAPTSEEA